MYNVCMYVRLYGCMYLQFQHYFSYFGAETEKGEMTLKCIAIVDRMPEIKNIPMIECTKCRKWFHVDCKVVPKQALDYAQANWFCCYCK